MHYHRFMNYSYYEPIEIMNRELSLIYIRVPTEFRAYHTLKISIMLRVDSCKKLSELG